MTTTIESCPAWCAGCTPPDKGGFGHVGEDRTVGLDLMAPETGDDPMHGLPYYHPAKLVAFLEQLHGAVLPTIHLDDGDGSVRHSVTLTLSEAMELDSILQELIEEARTSVMDRATAARSEGVTA
jgi:hypothetical protein